MRKKAQIEREMLHAREDLEDSLGKLLHKAREKISIRARIEHAVANQTPTSLIVALIAGAGFALLTTSRHS